MKTREWSSSLAFNLEIQWLSDYFCIKNSILFKYLFIKRFTSSKNESIFNQFMFLSANMLKSEHLAKKHSRNILMILINGSNMIKGRKNTSLVTYSICVFDIQTFQRFGFSRQAIPDDEFRVFQTVTKLLALVEKSSRTL